MSIVNLKMIFTKKQNQTRERPSSSVKTANHKIPVSSVFNDSEGLYRTTVCHCLVHRPYYSARLMGFGSRGPSELATEMPWPRLRRKTPYRDQAWQCLPSVFIGNVFYKQWHLCVLFHFRGYTTSGELQILIPRKKPHFRYGKN